MVARLVSLKLHLLRNGLRRSPWQVVGLVVALLYGLGLAALATAGLVALRWQSPEVAGLVVTLVGAALLAGWALLPLVAFGTDATLDPARLVLFPLTARQLVPGLLVAGVVGVPGLVTAVLALASVVTWSRSPLSVVVALLGAPVAVLTCVALSRLTTTAAAGALSGRRSREVTTAVVALGAVVVGPAVGWSSSSLSVGVDRAQLERVAGVLGWTPLGWVWSAPADVATGAPAAGLLKLLLAAALLAVVLLGWVRVLDAALVAGPGGHGGASRTRRAGGPGERVLARLETTPTGAVTARSLRYWRRDSRYATALVALLVIPLLAVVLPLVTGFSTLLSALLVGPALAFTLGWTSHNDVAYEGTAVWAHVAAGVPGRVDRAGRSLAVLVWGLPLVLAVTVAGVGVSGRWGALPAELGLVLAVLGAGQGVSAVASAVAPYRVPEPGANPFSTPQGAGFASVLAQLVTSLVTGVLALPAAGLLLAALLLDGPLAAGLSWAGLLVGAATGAGALLLGLAQGGRAFDRRGPELLTALAR